MPAGYNPRCVEGSKHAVEKAKTTKKKIDEDEGNRQHDEANARFDYEYGHQSRYWDF